MNGKVQFRGKEIVKNSESEFLNNGSELRISVWVGFFLHQSKYIWHEYDWNWYFSRQILGMWESNQNIILKKCVKDLIRIKRGNWKLLWKIQKGFFILAAFLMNHKKFSVCLFNTFLLLIYFSAKNTNFLTSVSNFKKQNPKKRIQNVVIVAFITHI